MRILLLVNKSTSKIFMRQGTPVSSHLLLFQVLDKSGSASYISLSLYRTWNQLGLRMPLHNICEHRVALRQCSTFLQLATAGVCGSCLPIANLFLWLSPHAGGKKKEKMEGDFSMVLRTYNLVQMPMETGVWTRGRGLTFEIFLWEIQITERYV